MKDIIKLGLFLAIVAIIAAFALSITYILTKPKIEEHKKIEIKKALKEILPEASSFVSKYGIYFGLNEKNKRVGGVFMVSPQGYSGPVEMMVGVNEGNKISGVKIIKLTETPGLGLKATAVEFLSQFKGKTKDDEIKAKNDIQAITGATITSQAVADGVKEALSKWIEYIQSSKTEKR